MTVSGSRRFSDFKAFLDVFMAACECEADRNWLLEVIAGRVDLLSLDVFPQMELLFKRYPEGCGEMYRLLSIAAEAYGDAAIDAAYLALSRDVIDDARRSARGY